MATNLEGKLNEILNEKIEKIKPENIRKGVTVFDIEGTYGGGSQNVEDLLGGAY